MTLVIKNTLNFQKNMDIRIVQVYSAQKTLYLIILDLNCGVYLSLCEYVMFVLTHNFNTKAEIAGITGKLHCLGKHVLCMKSHIAQVSPYSNLLLGSNANISKLTCVTKLCYIETH